MKIHEIRVYHLDILFDIFEFQGCFGDCNKSKYWQSTHKYGIQMPKNADEAYELNKANGNSLWADAIKDEIHKIIRSLEKHEVTEKELIDRGFK